MRALGLALALLLAFAAPAAAVPPRASLPDLEDEVMCVECGTSLAVSESPVAEQERSFIRREIAAGKDKRQIKADLVAEYGEQVLAEPRRHGFAITLWIVPILLVVLGAAGVAVALRRWRVRGPEAEPALPAALSAEDARRLDAELGT
jgi:cytochrome c-type biogenesis protein CcmH